MTDGLRLLFTVEPSSLLSLIPHQLNDDIALPDELDAVGDPARRCDLRQAPAAV